jgi:hypothetical protein
MEKVELKSESESEKINLIYNSDVYWEKIWRKIDKSKEHVMLVTYDMDNKMIANLTLRKLIE